MIWLRPALFDALHLSALRHGGIGSAAMTHKNAPLCAYGHAWFLDWTLANQLVAAGFDASVADVALDQAGISHPERVPFTRWCRIVGVDVVA